MILKKNQRVSQSSFLQKHYSRTVFLRWIRFYVTLRIHVHIQRHFVFWPRLWNKNSMHICRISDCFWCVDFSLRRNCAWATAFHTCMWFFFMKFFERRFNLIRYIVKRWYNTNINYTKGFKTDSKNEMFQRLHKYLKITTCFYVSEQLWQGIFLEIFI